MYEKNLTSKVYFFSFFIVTKVFSENEPFVGKLLKHFNVLLCKVL